MSGYLQLGTLWAMIAQGPIAGLIDILNSTFPSLFLKIFGVSQYKDLSLWIKALYDLVYKILDAVPFINGLTFANITLLNFMLGTGIYAVLGFSVFKWLRDVVKS